MHVAAGYMTRFQCIGTACEDTCCKAWDVPISQHDYGRLAGALGDKADELVARIPNGRGGSVVVLRKLPDRACPALDATGLCSVHARFGETALPDVCASYPRVIGQLGDRIELTGKMSCPEVARLVLLADDGALVPAPREAFGRENVRLSIARDGAPPYFAAFETVRDAIVELCVDDGFPFASRLYFVAELATRLAPFYHREATVAEPERLASTIAELRDARAELHATREASSPMAGLALQSVIGMLYARADASPAFTALVRKVAAEYGASDVDGLTALGPERLWETHVARRDTRDLDRYFARYSRNYWLQDWYPVSETLFEHVMHLVLRVALVRFLLVGHPDTGDRAAVEVFYATARAYDHNPEVRAAMSTTLVKRRMLTVEHCAALLAL
ncbi:MAG TPA: flagellin lysine-N-methylase [Kofleriaceae bacterium]